MLQSGILLAVGSAFLCGCADICASQGAKRLGALTTTFLALLIGALALALFGALAFERLGLTAQVLVWSMPIGVFAGAMTAIGYSSGYKGMSLGPLAIVSPIVATDGAIAGSLAMLLQHERVDGWQVGILAAIFLGVILACTSVRDLSRLLHPAQRKAALSLRGVHWGVLAALAFGMMLFTLGAGAQSWGWYLSLFWSRCSAAVALAVIVGQKRLRESRRQRPEAKELQGGGIRLRAGPCLALGGGLCETVGLVLFSLGTQIASTSIVAMIASTFTLVPLVFGVLRLGERPAANQWLGVGLVVIGLVLLGIKPA